MAGNRCPAFPVSTTPKLVIRALTVLGTTMRNKITNETTLFHRLFPSSGAGGHLPAIGHSCAVLPSFLLRDFGEAFLDKCNTLHCIGQGFLKGISLSVDARDVLAGNRKTAFWRRLKPKDIFAVDDGKWPQFSARIRRFDCAPCGSGPPDRFFDSCRHG